MRYAAYRIPLIIAQNHHKKIPFYRSTPFNGDKKNTVSRHFRLLNPYQQIQGKI